MSGCVDRIAPTKDDNSGGKTGPLSIPGCQLSSDSDGKISRSFFTELLINRTGKKAKDPKMSSSTPVVEVHQPPRTATRTRRTSRHERHRCHKSKHKTIETLQVANQNLLERINELKRENYILNRKINASVTSLDSGLSQNEVLSPFELDVNAAYQHVRNENSRLTAELDKFRARYRELETQVEVLERENRDLDGDVSMLKNLVYRLNVELENCQSGRGDGGNARGGRPEALPKNYQKNFLKPVLPLLRAYSEAVAEKSEMIENFEVDLKKFGLIFNDLLKENEKLYMELEKKMNTAEGDAANEVKSLRKELEMAKQENNLLISQIELEQEKLAEVHSVYRMKVTEVLKQNEVVNENLQEQKADLYMMRGKYAILKQEFERLKVENDSRVPMAVHSASIGECKRLFQDLRNEYESQKQHHLATIAEQEEVLARLRKQSEERTPRGDVEGEQKELQSIRRQLRDSNSRVEELSGKLSNTKKQLHKAMSFAEDIVREQESLLMQLHAKQKENSMMVSHFGSLKKQLKNVEKGAQEGLNTVEEKMKSLECENSKLTAEVKKLRTLLREREEIVARLHAQENNIT